MTFKPYIRAQISPELKEAFEEAVQANDRTVSQILRDLIREYVHRHANGGVWEPGAAIKGGRKHVDQ